MTRWFRKRWALAALVCATVTLGVASTRGADAPHKVGDVISLNFGGGEKQVKVLKIEKQADGSFHSEVKDQTTGETFTLVDRPENQPPAGAPKGTAPANSKQPAPPQAKPRTGDPLMPPASATPDLTKSKDAEKDKDKEKRPVMSRLFGDRDKPASPSPAANASAGTSASMKPAEPTEKKPGLMSRIFGSKKPSAPAGSTSAMVPPPAKPSAPSAPPAVVPTPGGLGKPSAPFFPPAGTTEPPRAMPATKPVAPPAPVVPVPSAPSAAPAFPKPAPLPLPAVPSVPAPLPSAPPVPLPGIPTLPGGTGSAKPSSGVVPASHAVPVAPIAPGAQKPIVVTPPLGVVPAGVAFDREVQPWVASLQTSGLPSERLLAAQALANCRHCGTDGVKAALFEAARRDPNGEVRAACINHLCKLGYFDAEFLAHIRAACTDANEDVCAAAKAACAKMLKK